MIDGMILIHKTCSSCKTDDPKMFTASDAYCKSCREKYTNQWRLEHLDRWRDINNAANKRLYYRKKDKA